MSTMYTLTAMTGKEASANRTVIIGTVEFNWRVWMILIWTSPIGLILTAVLWALIGQIAVICLPAVWGTAIYLVHRRTNTGLRLRTYQAMWDKKKASTDQFFLCGQPITINQSDYRSVTPNSVAYVPAAVAPSDTLVGTLLAREVPAGVVAVAFRDDPYARTHAAPNFEPVPIPVLTAPTAVPEPETQAEVDERFAAGFAAGIAERRAREAATREAVSAMTGVQDAWLADAAPIEARRAPAPLALPFAPAPTSVAVEASPSVPRHALDRLDATTIGVEAPDDLPDVGAFFGDEDSPAPGHAHFGRKKDTP